MQYPWLVALGAVVVAVALALPRRQSVRRKFVNLMADRTRLSEADFALLFPGAEESAAAVRQAIAVAVPGDGSLMRPRDRIVKDLMVDALEGLNTNVIVATLERRFSIHIPGARAAEVRTVQELVELVQSLRDGV